MFWSCPKIKSTRQGFSIKMTSGQIRSTMGQLYEVLQTRNWNRSCVVKENFEKLWLWICEFAVNLNLVCGNDIGQVFSVPWSPVIQKYGLDLPCVGLIMHHGVNFVDKSMLKSSDNTNHRYKYKSNLSTRYEIALTTEPHQSEANSLVPSGNTPLHDVDPDVCRVNNDRTRPLGWRYISTNASHYAGHWTIC